MVEAYQSKVFHSSRILTTSMATDGEVSVAASFSSINRALRVFRYVAQIPEKNNHELSIDNYAIQFGENKIKFQKT